MKIYLPLIAVIGVLLYVIFAPFNSPIFFGLLVFGVAVEIWAVYMLIKLTRAKGTEC